MRKILLLITTIIGVCLAAKAEVATDYFANTKKADKKERAASAYGTYYKIIYRLEPSVAIESIKQLEQWSIKNKDERLQAVSLILQGDYYKQHKNESKAFQFLNAALALATKKKLKEEQAVTYNLHAWLYYHSGRHPQAFENILKAHEIIKNDIGNNNYLFTNRNLYDLGYMYYDFSNYNKAKAFLLEGLKYPFFNSIDEIGSYNTLGLTYQRLNNFDSASFYFKKVINVAKAVNHKAWIGIATGNLGAVYYYQGKYDEAIPLLEADYKSSLEANESRSAGNALCMWADINLKRHNFVLALNQLDEVEKLQAFPHDKKLRRTYYLGKAEAYSATNQYKLAYQALDSARLLQMEISKRNDGITFSQAEQKIAVEQHLAQMSVLKAEESNRILIRNFIIIVTLLTLVIGAQFMYRQKQKQNRNKQELADASDKLNKYLESIREKNLMIENFRAEIDSLHNMSEFYANTNTLIKEKEEIADKLKKYTILTDDHWNEFRHLFGKVHNDFFPLLKEKFPMLTQAEVRMLSLVKLNLSRKEMAEMLGISPDSVKKTGQRIRKKVELPENMDLEDMIAALYK